MVSRERLIVVLVVVFGGFSLTGCAVHVQAPPELTSAISNGDFDTVKSILKENPKLVNSRTEHGHLLHDVYYSPKFNMRKQVIEYLIANGANVNTKDNHGRAPLHLAVVYYTHKKTAKDIAELLIDNGANVNAKDNDGLTPLYRTLNARIAIDVNNPQAGYKRRCGEDCADIAKFLIDKGADVKIRTDGGSILTSALECRYTEIAAIVIAKGANVNVKGTWYGTPLNYAVSKGYLEISRLLVAGGANVNAKYEWQGVNMTPLGFAAQRGDLQMTRFLVAAGANVNSGNGSNVTPPLHLAAKDGHKDLVEFLIAKGADVNAKRDCWYMTKPLARLPVIKGSGSKMLKKYLMKPHPAVFRSVSPLYLAARGGHKNVTELLIAEGAEVNARAKDGDSPLHEAAGGGHKEVADLLIAQGANVNAKGRRNYTPLHSAASGGHKEVAQLLINKGAQVNAKSDLGGTPLRHAENRRHKEVAELLRKHGGIE